MSSALTVAESRPAICVVVSAAACVVESPPMAAGVNPASWVDEKLDSCPGPSAVSWSEVMPTSCSDVSAPSCVGRSEVSWVVDSADSETGESPAIIDALKEPSCAGVSARAPSWSSRGETPP